MRHRALLAGWLCAAYGAQASNTLTLYNAETGSITAQPYTFGRAFAQGEIVNCPVPVVGGVPLDTAHRQADVKNRWPDGSVRYAIITVIGTIANGGSVQIQSFNDVAGGCNNSGFLTQAQMTGFNSGNWGAQMELTSSDGAATVTRNAAAMLAQTDPAANAAIGSASWPDCKNDYWLQGPLVTAVVVQDCTGAGGTANSSVNDFAFKDRAKTVLWDSGCNASTTTACKLSDGTDVAALNPSAGSPVRIQIDNEQMDVTAISGTTPATLTVIRGVNGTTAAAHGSTAVVTNVGQSSLYYSTANAFAKSLHPKFVLYFYSSINAVKVDFCTENSLVSSAHDQQYNIVLKTGNPLSQVYSLSTVNSKQYTHIAGTTWRKTFWSGTAPGKILIDHNFAYLKSAKVLPNYDPSVTVSPESVNGYQYCSAPNNTDYKCFASGDKGDIWGFALENWQGGHGYSGNNEMAPIQREDLDYLYNMGNDCGTANGLCAKAWYILTATHGGRDSGLAAEVPGGAGMWNNQGNVPYHWRENRPSLPRSYYCGNLANINATINTSTCTSGVGNPIGRPPSRQAADFTIQGQDYNGNNMGTITQLSSDGLSWSGLVGSQWWLDYYFVAYLLTGDYYYMDAEMLAAGWTMASINYGNAAWASNGFFAFASPISTAVRGTAGLVQTNAYAAFIAPDNSPESLYFTSVVNSNLEILEGMLGLTGTTLTPTAADSSGFAVNTNCVNYDYTKANRWNWGHCTVMSQCLTTGTNCPAVITPTLHSPNPGACIGTQPTSYSNQQTVTAASNANGVALTVANAANLASNVDVWGATGSWAAGGPNGTGINGLYLATAVDSTHVKLTAINTTNTTNYPQPMTGSVQISSQWVDSTKVTDIDDPWNNNYFGSVMGHLAEKGFKAAAISLEMEKGLVEQFEDSTYNPYFVALYQRGIKNGALTCSPSIDGTSKNPFLANWAAVKAAEVPDLQNMATFDSTGMWQPGECGDHSYPTVAYAAATFAKSDNPTANCAGVRSGESCDGASAWTWAVNHIPYFANAVTGSISCGTSDVGIKWALAPRIAPGCTAPSLTSSSPLPGATLGIPYSFIFTASGSTPLTWSATGTPGWAAFNTSTGGLSGTPNATGASTINVGATNSCGGAGPSAFSLTVNAAPLITSPPTLPPGTRNSSYGYQMTASGGTLPLAWSLTAGSLPTGLSLSGGGLIGGTPSVLQSVSFTITVTDANGAASSATFSLTINPPTNGSALTGPVACTGCVLR